MAEELQAEVGTEALMAAPVSTAPAGNKDSNIPLNDSQKLVLRTYQSRLTTLAKQKADIDVQVARIEGAMQVDMMKIAMSNNIDPEKFGFNDSLEIIPAQKSGVGGGTRGA
jgi:hypothetical protein